MPTTAQDKDKACKETAPEAASAAPRAGLTGLLPLLRVMIPWLAVLFHCVVVILVLQGLQRGPRIPAVCI